MSKIAMGKVGEACPIGMAPSVSTTVMLALGDALSLAVMKARRFTKEDYARFHPGGALGRSLLRRFALRPAQSVETQIHRHPVKPRFNPRALRAPFRRVLPKPQKRFLRDVFRRRAVSQHAIAGGENSVRMPNDKLARCKTVAPSRPLDKRFVRIV